ncbi:hypothetical protein ACFWZ2_35010 [Streptomyces sp. NPDC059002]|uniref:hypothetical protein n=1 Tax=Streptomyces sp. NPDC059002 TaxID=3346690 RepID=UPI00369BF664
MACSGGGSGSGPAHESPKAHKSSTPHESPKARQAQRPQQDDPNLLRGFRHWLRTNDTRHDDALAGHTLHIGLDYRAGDRAGAVKVLTDYGPWSEAEGQVGPLAKAFTQWWDEDPAAASARFLGQGGKTAKQTTLYDGPKPSNLLEDFRSWTAENAPNGERLAPHLTALGIGYGFGHGTQGTGAITLSTDYLTYKDHNTQQNLDALGDAFADWWDGDKGAESVTVTSDDQGSHAGRRLTAP